MPQKPRATERDTERMAEAVETALSGALRSIANQQGAKPGSVLFPEGITKIVLKVTVTSFGSFELEVSGPDPAKPASSPA